MKKLSYGITTPIFSIILLFTPAWAQQTTGPRMVIGEGYFDAREVKEGDVIEHMFTVLNRGDRTLEIQKVNPG